MKTSYNAIVSLTLSLLLCVPVASASSDGQSKIDLRLEEALTFSGDGPLFAGIADGETEPWAEGASEVTAPSQPRLEEPGRTPIGVSAQSSKAAAEAALADRAAGGDGGFGRWIKKHWYVPVLAAVAIGVVVSDDGDDGPGDVED